MDMTSYIIGRKSAGGSSDITIDDVIAITGELDNLDTTDKSNLVNAINEVASSSGAETYFVEDSAIFTFLNKKKGIYVFKSGGIAVKFDNTFVSSVSVNNFPLVIYLYQDITNDLQDGEVLGYYTTLAVFSENTIIKKDSTSNTGLSTSVINSVKVVTADDTQNIGGKKTFRALPETSIVPTANNQMVNKKYVDDAISAAITTTLGGSY